MLGCVGSGVVTPLVGVGVVGGLGVLEGVGVGSGVKPMMLTQMFTFAHRPPQLDPMPEFQASSCSNVMPFKLAISEHPWSALTK